MLTISKNTVFIIDPLEILFAELTSEEVAYEENIIYENNLEANNKKYTDYYAGGFELSKGDYEGAILAKFEFDSGYLS